LERHLEGRLAMLTLTDDMMRQARAKPDDIGKLVNYARALAGVEVGALLTEGEKDIYVSLRGKGALDVARVAARFGGGGHKNAAGCALPVTADPQSRRDARERLIDAIADALDERD